MHPVRAKQSEEIGASLPFELPGTPHACDCHLDLELPLHPSLDLFLTLFADSGANWTYTKSQFERSFGADILIFCELSLNSEPRHSELEGSWPSSSPLLELCALPSFSSA